MSDSLGLPRKKKKIKKIAPRRTLATAITLGKEFPSGEMAKFPLFFLYKRLLITTDSLPMRKHLLGTSRGKSSVGQRLRVNIIGI